MQPRRGCRNAARGPWRSPRRRGGCRARRRSARASSPCCARSPSTTLAADFSAMRSSAGERRRVEPVEVGRRLDQSPRRPAGRPASRPGPRCPSRAALAKCSSACLRCGGQYRPAGAARHGLVGAGARPPTRNRAARRHREPARAGRALLWKHAHHLGDHVAGAPHDHRVADPDVLAPQLVLVVQRRVGHGDAAHEHRLEPRHRRQRAGAPDLDLDAEHLRRRLLGRELVRDREARRARHEAQPLLRSELVDLVDHAVDLEGQTRPRFAPMSPIVAEQPVDAARTSRRSPLTGKSQRRRQSSSSRMRRRAARRSLDVADAVGEERERPAAR